MVVQTIGAGLVGASTSAFFEDEAVAVSYEQAGNIMISGLALQVCPPKLTHFHSRILSLAWSKILGPKDV